MALNQSALSAKLKTAFKKAKDEAWNSDKVADELASAIHAYVSAAEVTGVTSDVVVNLNGTTKTGTATQTDAVNIT